MIEYKNPIPVAVALIPYRTQSGDIELLGVIRGNAPGRGGVALPGGYVDNGEAIESAMAREVEEECGLTTQANEWQLVSSHITPENRVLVFGGLRRILSLNEIAFDRPPCPEVLGLTSINMSTTLVFPSHQAASRIFLCTTVLGDARSYT
jgi:ADP-ribose pyrophosphatase YjhB (NUDIX family)